MPITVEMALERALFFAYLSGEVDIIQAAKVKIFGMHLTIQKLSIEVFVEFFTALK